MRVYESWLKSKDHEKWAKAMCVCESGAPWCCGEIGECIFGGCFSADVSLSRRLRRAAINTTEEMGALLRLAAAEIEYLQGIGVDE